MLTKEVREWLEKVNRGQYSYEDALSEFVRFTPFLTREEMIMIKNKLFKGGKILKKWRGQMTLKIV